MDVSRVFLSCCLLTAAVAAKAQSILSPSPIPDPPTRAWRKKEYRIAPAVVAPKIDGIIDDGCWKTATHADAFFRFQSLEPVHEQTEAWLCADRSHLYVAFHCQDSHPELIRASETQREGDIGHDDIVGVAIDSQGTQRNASQFEVNARGTQQTQLEQGTADNLTWAGDWRAATHRVADGWTAEISVPFSMLRYPRGATSFGIALIRYVSR